MIDLHSHIIFDVDDGSETLEESIGIIKKAQQRGIKGMFATPHYMPGMMADKDNVKMKLEELKRKLLVESVNMQLYLGHELYVDYSTLKDLYQGKVLTLNNSRYVLIELPMATPLVELEEILFEMSLKSYVPIIAHPERYVYLQKNICIAEKWIKKGALLQLNLPSVYGKFGESAKRTAMKLLRRNMYHFVGTDVHALQSASLTISSPLNQIKRIVGDEILNDMIHNNPIKVIENKVIEPFIIRQNKFSFIELIRNRIG